MLDLYTRWTMFGDVARQGCAS